MLEKDDTAVQTVSGPLTSCDMVSAQMVLVPRRQPVLSAFAPRYCAVPFILWEPWEIWGYNSLIIQVRSAKEPLRILAGRERGAFLMSIN